MAAQRVRTVRLLAWIALAGACSPAPFERERAAAQAVRHDAPPPLPAPARADSMSPLVRRSIRLTVLGSFPDEAIGEIERALREQLAVEVLPSERRELPAEAFYAPRKRYRAELLLAALEHPQRGAAGQLGMTEVDISTTKGKVKDWGVFGLGTIGGDSAVISTYRLRRDQPSPELYRFRVVTTAVHEVGHMLGLDHCKEPRCLMNDAEGSIRVVDQSSGTLGPICQGALTRLAPRKHAPSAATLNP